MLFELKHNKTLADIPKLEYPQYIIAKEGVFLDRPSILGRAIIKSPMPPYLGQLKPNGTFNGQFTWEAPTIPGELCSQIVNFFQRIYTKYGTEAQVILTIHRETKEWRVFIPTQEVTGTSVNSVYDPAHISNDYFVVGTMHSHCDFSAFHSMTDETDADEMDGVHFTIGNLTKETPDVAAMVSFNKVQFTYEPDQLADFSKLGTVSAPAWWDNYITPKYTNQNKKVVGLENFKRYQRNEKDSTYYDNYLHYTDEEWDKLFGTQPIKTTYKPYSKGTYKEHELGEKLADKLYDAKILTEEDTDQLYQAGWDTADKFLVRTVLINKIRKSQEILKDLGMNIVVSILPEEVKTK